MTATTTSDRARVAEQPQAARSGAARSDLSNVRAVETGDQVFSEPSSPRNVPAQEKGRSGPGGFRIRWGRTLVALTGLLAMLTTVVTAPLAAFTPLVTSVPLTAGGVLLLCMIMLRSMAVSRRRRRRRKRLEAAMAEAMNPKLPVEDQRRPSVPSTFGTVRGIGDGKAHGQGHRSSAQGESAETPARETHVEQEAASRRDLDEDGLPRDLAATFEESQVPQAPAAQGVSQVPAGGVRQDWQPREVPKPQYLEAEKAERTQPEPLVPQEPKPTTEVKIREDLPNAGVSSTAPSVAAEAPEQKELAATGTDNGSAKTPASPAGVQESLDLDAVLKRRRA